MVEMVKQQIKDGTTTDWGTFVGEARGYSIGEVSEVELAKNLQKYYPFVNFEVHQMISVDEMAEVIKSLAE
jgi:hypothetical protein